MTRSQKPEFRIDDGRRDDGRRDELPQIGAVEKAPIGFLSPLRPEGRLYK